MTAAPRGQSKAAEPNTNVPDLSLAAPAAGQPIEAGAVLVTEPAESVDGAPPQPKVVKRKTSAKVATPKNDPLKSIDAEKLPVAVQVGPINLAVRVYAGRPVLYLSLVGWIGEEPVQILAEEAEYLDQALAELRKVLA